MSEEEFLPLFQKSLAALKYQVGMIWYSDVRAEINNVQKYLASKPNIIDAKVVLVPFLTAFPKSPQVFQLIVMDAFIVVAKHLRLSSQIMLQILDCLGAVVPNKQDESIEKIAHVCLSIYLNHSSSYYLHGSYLKRILRILFDQFGIAEKDESKVAVKDAIRDIINHLFDNYTKTIPIKRTSNIGLLSQQVIASVAQNSAHIRKYLGPIIAAGDYSVTIRDVDMSVLFTMLCDIIEARKEYTAGRYATAYLNFCFNKQSPFFSSTTFKFLLQNTIHVTILSMFLAGGLEHSLTGSIVISIWRNYSDFYLDGLYECLKLGLATTLSSPDPEVLNRALDVYQQIAQVPQMMVDMFVNYDCDRSGFFTNVFQDSLEKIIKLSYPDLVMTQIQRHALETVVSILSGLWQYFTNFEVSTEKAEAPQDFLEAKKTKAKLDVGLELFKKSYKKGIQFLVSNGFVQGDDVSIADFLYSTPSLDPVMVGQLLGDANSGGILKEYMKHFDFRGVSFEEGFRMFLSSFQIPGEAQMIDRVMEQFGQRYFNANPGQFDSADDIYMLAFATLMLHTDAHHPTIKKHMTLEEFIRNVSGASNGSKKMTKEFLTEIYNGITSKQIFANPSTTPSMTLLTLDQRSELYNAQIQTTLENVKQRAIITNKSFHRSESPLFVGPMFQSFWGGALATLTITLQQSEEQYIYKLCLDGLATAVHIASHCFVEQALSTLVDAFSKFTNLRKSLTEVKEKNVHCTNALLRIAIEDKNFLRGAWEIVLGEISAIDRIKIELPVVNSVLIDELFMATDSLDRESIVDFLRSLVAVSRQELAEKVPRQFSLHQLAVVAHFNMKRPHFIWLSIWSIIGDHISDVGSRPDENLADITIDIVRQIALKFLAVEELSQFHFQEHFMQPFQQIFERQPLPGPKILVAECLGIIVHELAGRLRSGWSTVLAVVELGARSKGAVREATYRLLSDIVASKLDAIEEYHGRVATAISAYLKRPLNIEDPMALHRQLHAAMAPNSSQWAAVAADAVALYRARPEAGLALMKELLEIRNAGLRQELVENALARALSKSEISAVEEVVSIRAPATQPYFVVMLERLAAGGLAITPLLERVRGEEAEDDLAGIADGIVDRFSENPKTAAEELIRSERTVFAAAFPRLKGKLSELVAGDDAEIRDKVAQIFQLQMTYAEN